MKIYGGVDVQTSAFLTSTPVGTERWAWNQSRFTHANELPVIHWTAGWMGPEVSKMWRSENSWKSSDASVLQVVIFRHTDCVTVALSCQMSYAMQMWCVFEVISWKLPWMTEESQEINHEECLLLGYKNPVHISPETYYVIATEYSQLMLCKIWGFHGSDYEECLLGYKTPVRTSQETHYVPARESSQLMLCKFWGFYGCNYEECRLLGYKNAVRTSQETHYVSGNEECRLLGYKNPVRTSQETHYVSGSESSQLMLCRIGGFHDSDYEEFRLLGGYTVWLL
jgi:hypothetical protein